MLCHHQEANTHSLSQKNYVGGGRAILPIPLFITIDCTKDSVAFHLFKDEEEPPAIVVHVDERSGVDEEHDPGLGKWLLGCFSLDFKEELNLDSFMELSEPRRSFAS